MALSLDDLPAPKSSALSIDDLPAPRAKPDSAPKRFQRGVASGLVGAAQIAAHMGIGNQDVLDRAAKEINRDSASGAPQGESWLDRADIAGGLGKAALSAPVALATGGTSIPAMIAGGAATGAAAGLLEPASDSEHFIAAKAGQVAAGAASGSVAGPVGGVLLGRIAPSVVKGIAARLKSDAGSPNINIDLEITNALKAEGIDPAHVSKAFKDQVRKQVAEAQKAGGTLDQKALGNKAAADIAGVDLTKGQVTRDPSQWGQEHFLSQIPGSPLAEQSSKTLATLNQRLLEMQDNAAKVLNEPSAGKLVSAPLEAAQSRGKQLVDSLYDIARNKIGNNAVLDSRAIADNYFAEAQKRSVLKQLPADLRTFVNDISTGKAPLTVNRAAEVMQNINAYLSADKGTPSSVALGILKNKLEDGLGTLADNSGTDAAQAYALARHAAAQKFALEDAIPALKNAKTGKVDPDDFMRRFVYGATQEQLGNMKEFLLKADPSSWNQIRGQVLGDLRAAAGQRDSGSSASKLLPARLNKEIDSLEKDGHLQVLFSPSEVQMLRAVGRTGEAVLQPPSGVSITGMGGAAKAGSMLADAVGKAAKLKTGINLTPGVTSVKQSLQASKALQSAPVTTIPPAAQPSPIYSRVGYGMGASIVPAAVENGLGYGPDQ